ncbi:MAG TPA: CRISPR system precrRNA processing endoribonuclease RAMP protein Cas6 [Nitrospirota bacterium]|nr:CRISPR system precrRNA processing endoribonuclease RAMP protein Cas6 [Nitrospirota bacterium]
MIIRYQKYKFTIEASEALALPDYKGSTFRGAFGNAFKRVVCALKRNDCRDCLLKTRCVYAYVFETSPPEGTDIMGMNKYEAVPHPFVIEPPVESKRAYNNGDILHFNLILVGKGIDYLPYFIYTFEELGRIGIGKGRGRYKFLSVKDGDEPVYSIEDKVLRNTVSKELYVHEDFKPDPDMYSDSGLEDTITIRFLTPARIKHQRSLAVELEFHILIRNLLRRLCLLYYFHCGGKEPSWDYKGIIREAEKIVIEKDSLRWKDWERYSSRQDVRMKMGGVMGEVTYRGRLKPFTSILKAGSILHIGKGTSFGLGKYEIQ